jgi:hypothetical protein
MNPIKWLKSLFSPNPSGLPETKVEAPLPPSEPSCLIKGIAQAWIDGKGWKVSRTRKAEASWGTREYFSWSVTLTHRDLGVSISLQESCCPKTGVSDIKPQVSDIVVVIQGSRIPMNGLQDSRHLKQAIESHPYPQLRSRQAVYAKQEASRASSLKQIEALGCPAKMVVNTEEFLKP